MVYRSFRFQCVLRALLLAATLYLCIHLALRTDYLATPLVVALLAGYQLYALIHYVEKTNRDLTRFLAAVRQADFSQSFSSQGLGVSFEELKRSFDEVLEAFRRERAEKEQHHRYLQTVVQHIGIGLLVYQRGGEVDLINTAARRLLSLSHLKHLDALAQHHPQLARALLDLGPQQKRLVRVEVGGEAQQLAVHATAFRLYQREYLLASLQNIHGELEEKEMEAWQNLIRVLTHEIMNSITPISSLADTASGLLGSRGELAADALADARESVRAIHRRSEGLLHFVESYRNLTHLPQPDFQIVPAVELLQRVAQLLRAQLEEAGVALAVAGEPRTLELTADPEQIEQVLINLVRNAADALRGRDGARIELRAGMDGRGRPQIEVRDNGPGIVEEALSQIFIPFFTTKQDGSGIGLSLCRQIMRLHGGHISARSTPEVETVFALRF